MTAQPLPLATVPTNPAAPAIVADTSLAEEIAPLGYLVADLAAFVDGIDGNARANLVQIDTLRRATQDFGGAIAALHDGFRSLGTSALETEAAAAERLDAIAENGRRYQELSAWGTGIGPRTEDLEHVLSRIVASNDDITRIARQVNILAINASIEAARAGDAGRGFAIVAEAVKDLSHKTADAAGGIRTAVTSLDGWTRTMREDSRRLTPEFARGLEIAASTQDAVAMIADQMSAARTRIEALETSVNVLASAEKDVGEVCDIIDMGTRHTATGVDEARNRTNHMMDRCEALLQRVAEVETDGPDRPFIAHAQTIAGRIAAAFETALETGQITEEDLFDTRLAAIPGSDPPQFMARHSRLTDTVVPPIIENALRFDPNILFTCPCDRQGYIATHNRKFSALQSDDPAWNAANCRNRRLFDDRTGRQAGASRAPFLMQVYRRDMGAQGMVMMKDISAPITVRGRHWGGLRIGYRNTVQEAPHRV
jgi:methyl-accepting chemotaxis protein